MSVMAVLLYSSDRFTTDPHGVFTITAINTTQLWCSQEIFWYFQREKNYKKGDSSKVKVQK